MIKWFRQTTKKSRAAVIVQNLLEMTPGSFLVPSGPAKFANSLVEGLWDEEPGYFEGKNGPVPSHITIAAAALARGMRLNGDSVVMHTACKGALGFLLMDLDHLLFNYSLNGKDRLLLSLSQDQYNRDEWKFVKS